MADLNIFIYKDINSVIHRMHPTLKILLMIFSSFLITNQDIIVLLYFLIVIFIVFLVSNLDKRLLFKDFKYLLILILVISFFSSSFKSGIIYVLRIGEMLLLGTLFMATTNPLDITQGLYKIIRNKKLAQNISLTITLIPTFLISWKEIEISLRSRGLYIRKNPIRILYSIVLPLLVETFKKSENISMAMESRCYTGWIDSEVINKEVKLIMILPVLLQYLLLIKRLLL